MNKLFDKARSAVTNAAKKFTNVSVNRGKTAYPKKPKDLENLGIRWDYDGEVEDNGTFYNKFQVQPNAGKVPSTIREWREKNGGTHAIMGVMYVKKGGSLEDVAQGWEKFEKEFKSEGTGNMGPATGEASSSQSDWIWNTEQGQYYRQRGDGTIEWSESAASSDEWAWSAEHKRYYRLKADGTYEWS